MLDLGTSFLASVARDPGALAILDGPVRLTYAQWYGVISRVVAGFDRMGLKPGDHLGTVLQNRWEAATLHWACQFLGVVITPLNWRAKADEVAYCLRDAEARAVFFESVSAAALEAVPHAQRLPLIGVGPVETGGYRFAELLTAPARLRHAALHAVAEQDAVGQPGERIVVRDVLQTGLVLLLPGDVGQRPGKARGPALRVERAPRAHLQPAESAAGAAVACRVGAGLELACEHLLDHLAVIT